jgi:hypothetical protein
MGISRQTLFAELENPMQITPLFEIQTGQRTQTPFDMSLFARIM